jgi:hypothetical protein
VSHATPFSELIMIDHVWERELTFRNSAHVLDPFTHPAQGASGALPTSKVVLSRGHSPVRHMGLCLVTSITFL